MDPNNRDNTSGFGTTDSSERIGTRSGSSGDAGFKTSGAIGTTNATETESCAHCGQPLNQNRGLEQFLGRVGISEEMINNLKSQIQNVDIEEYLNTAREYLRTAGEKVKPNVEKAKTYTKENPGKVAAGIAILAVGAGLLINSMRER